mmetsp:Transcript_15278/g.27072  ORF Transcript_15278/g.27072 Transcript_15278/m.27072 type:complete len:109 (+) Transcript_15278:1943-2269(+)
MYSIEFFWFLWVSSGPVGVWHATGICPYPHPNLGSFWQPIGRSASSHTQLVFTTNRRDASASLDHGSSGPHTVFTDLRGHCAPSWKASTLSPHFRVTFYNSGTAAPGH